MLLVLMKYAKVLLMYSSFLLFELLVSSLFCITIDSLKSAFPSVQSSSLLDKCLLLMVFEVLLKDFCSSKFGRNIKLFKAVVLDGLSDIQQSINFVSSCTNLPALFDGRQKRFFFQKIICSYTSYIVFSYSSDAT